MINRIENVNTWQACGVLCANGNQCFIMYCKIWRNLPINWVKCTKKTICWFRIRILNQTIPGELSPRKMLIYICFLSVIHDNLCYSNPHLIHWLLHLLGYWTEPSKKNSSSSVKAINLFLQLQSFSYNGM